MRGAYDKYASKYLKIQTKTMKLVPFKFNRVQRVLWKRILEENLRTGKPVRWLILKGRQMGMSTWIAGLYYWICSLRSNRNAVVAAHKESSSVELFRKQQLFWRETPSESRPMAKTNNRGHLEFANPNPTDDTPGLESQILVDVASNVDLGRSFALHLLHWSEFAMTHRPTETLAAARNAMPNIAGTFLIIETTAKGPGPFKDLWEDEENDYEKIFICWVAEDEYRVDMDPDDYFEPHDADHPRYGNEKHELERIIVEIKNWYPEYTSEGEIFHEGMCRLAWRRQTIDGECGGDIRLFRQEYPTVPNDAFIGTGRSLFDSYKLADWMAGLVNDPPVEHAYRFDFRKEMFELRKYGHLKLYEPIQENATYVIGCDPALGVKGGDPSTAVILRCPELVQAGVFRAIIPPDKYPRLYVREDLTGRRDKRQSKYGWKTNAVTKDTMITDLGNAINSDLIEVLDRDTLHELMNFQEIVTDSGRKSTGVPSGMGHDDLAIALMIAYQMATRAYHQVQKPQRGPAPKFSLPWWEKQIDAPGKFTNTW